MAHIFGCLITGGEVRRARLIESSGGNAGGEKTDESNPAAQSVGGLKLIGPIIASLFAMVACAAAMIIVDALLGEPVTEEFNTGRGLLAAASLPKQIPVGWEGFWEQIAGQVALLKRMSETWARVDWLNWRVGVFAYLSICLAVRLAPARGAVRSALAAAVVFAGAVAAAGAISSRFKDVMNDIWPLLTYVWSLLLFLLLATLIIRGLIALARSLAVKKP